MSIPGLITMAVLSGGLLAADPDISAASGSKNVIPIHLGESYLLETDRIVGSVLVSPAAVIAADLVNLKAIVISGEVIGTARIVVLDEEGEPLFSTGITVTPRLWGQQ